MNFLYTDAAADMHCVDHSGAKVLRPAENQFWGDRIAWIMDPSEHVWTVATRIEETTEEQRQGRWSAELAESNPSRDTK